MFGHVVNLNFNHNGSSHNTFIGGMVSGVVKILIYYYVTLRFMTVIFYGDTNINSAPTVIDLEAHNVTNYNET